MSGQNSSDLRGENLVQAAIDAGFALAEPRELENLLASYSVTVPAGATHALVRAPAPHPDFESAPTRARGTYRPATVEALIDVIERHDNPALTVWVHPTSGQVTAVFNDHTTDPAWRDHRAQLNLAVTPEWGHWTRKDHTLMSQVEFAEHIEDGVAEIVEPAAADMLELAQTFHAHSTAAFRSANRLHSGQVQVRYDEEIDAKAGQSGQMDIPTEFKLAVAPFLGEDRYAVTALLRYRVNGGKLSIGYKLQRPDVVVRDALDKIAERLREKFPNVFLGEPGV